MDYYRGFREGVTVYFPVFVEGALLHVGDGHACLPSCCGRSFSSSQTRGVHKLCRRRMRRLRSARPQ
jgi:hypothetical protein